MLLCCYVACVHAPERRCKTFSWHPSPHLHPHHIAHRNGWFHNSIGRRQLLLSNHEQHTSRRNNIHRINFPQSSDVAVSLRAYRPDWQGRRIRRHFHSSHLKPIQTTSVIRTRTLSNLFAKRIVIPFCKRELHA